MGYEVDGDCEEGYVSEGEFANMLEDLLWNSESLGDNQRLSVSTFEERMVLTNDKGLVVTLGDADFYLTIHRRSR